MRPLGTSLLNAPSRLEHVPLDTPFYRAYRAVYSKEVFVMPHHHDELEILVYLENGGQAWIGGRPYCIMPHTLHVISSGLVHAFHIQPGQKSCVILVLQIVIKEIDRILSGKNESNQLRRAFAQRSIETTRHKEQIVRKILSLSSFVGDKSSIAPASHLHDLEYICQICQLLLEETNTQVRANLPDERIQKIMDAVEKRIHEPFVLGAIARDVGLSQFHVCRIFRGSTGMTLSQFALRSKLEMAAQLLRNHHKNISQICEECGFNSLSYFIQSFKTVYGESPKRWQRNINGPLKTKVD